MSVWPFTGFINHDDESEHGNICEEFGEDHDDVENHDEDGALEEIRSRRKDQGTFLFQVLNWAQVSIF